MVSVPYQLSKRCNRLRTWLRGRSCGDARPSIRLQQDLILRTVRPPTGKFVIGGGMSAVVVGGNDCLGADVRGGGHFVLLLAMFLCTVYYTSTGIGVSIGKPEQFSAY